MSIAALSIVALYLFAALVYDVLWYRRRNRKVRRVTDGRLVSDLLDSGRMK
jgi:O-antigen/teichoic acid export membrane protein